MWLDVFLQLGVIGVALIGLTMLAFVWRSWFFAVDRPAYRVEAALDGWRHIDEFFATHLKG